HAPPPTSTLFPYTTLFRSSGEFLPLGQITEAHFDKYFGINVKGTLFTVQKALPLMPDGASIVLNGSMVSVKGLPAFSVYAATKRSEEHTSELQSRSDLVCR